MLPASARVGLFFRVLCKYLNSYSGCSVVYVVSPHHRDDSSVGIGLELLRGLAGMYQGP
jgi:hypothetical protein